MTARMLDRDDQRSSISTSGNQMLRPAIGSHRSRSRQPADRSFAPRSRKGIRRCTQTFKSWRYVSVISGSRFASASGLVRVGSRTARRASSLKWLVKNLLFCRQAVGKIASRSHRDPPHGIFPDAGVKPSLRTPWPAAHMAAHQMTRKMRCWPVRKNYSTSLDSASGLAVRQ